ncbi:MAG TPA: hypothetical protein ENJ09_08070 [Planctomycetes bacterium]|nr:hypothetical protein [Planctomycetota bacterium]
MKGFTIILRRELAGLYFSPVSWFLLAATLLYNGFFFLTMLQASGGEVNLALSAMHQGPLWFLLSFLAPLLTMRMISEEGRSGMLEFLLTAPVTDAAVVLGKLVASTVFLVVAWTSVPLYALLCQFLGAPPDWGQVATQWLGVAFVATLFSGIGLVASAASATPLFAAFLAILANLLLLVLPLATGFVRGPWREGAEWVRDKIDVQAHFQGSFLTGAIDSAHLVFYAAWIGLVVFLAVRLLESKRWAR